jgi:hypothetical protein
MGVCTEIISFRILLVFKFLIVHGFDTRLIGGINAALLAVVPVLVDWLWQKPEPLADSTHPAADATTWSTTSSMR